MRRVNCWEHKRCGREPGGACVDDLGVCPAATEQRTDGLNHGENGGRVCWGIVGTLCGGVVQGSFARKLGDCWKCEFYVRVMEEEGADVVLSKGIRDRLSEPSSAPPLPEAAGDRHAGS